MSHQIETFDKILVADGQANKTWHGLETCVGKEITTESVQDLHFPIVETKLAAITDGGESFKMDEWKCIGADVRDREDIPHSFIPLHVPKESYQIISNARVWEAMQNALKGIDHTISCVGTLKGLRKYFISVELDEAKTTTINGDLFHSHLNFVTSHDGSLSFVPHNSMTRAVCWNTVSYSLETAGMKFRIPHTKNAEIQIQGVERLIQGVLKSQISVKRAVEKFATIGVSDDDIRGIVGGYFLVNQVPADKLNDVSDVRFATKTRNKIDSIVDLAKRGKGNKGETLYDVMNGATEYWTSGNGVGMLRDGQTPQSVNRSTKSRRVFSAQFGGGQNHKARFIKYLNDGNWRGVSDKANRVMDLSIAG